MQGVCRLSRRWHQQFCLSPTFAAHQRCLGVLQPVRLYRRGRPATPLRRTAPRLPGEIKVHEFEQQGHDDSTRIPVRDHLGMEERRVRAELDALDQELAILRQGPFGPNSEFMRSFPTDEREALLRALDKEGLTPPEAPDLITDEELEEVVREDEGRPPVESSPQSPLQVTLQIAPKEKIYIKRFNRALQLAQQGELDEQDEKTFFALFKWYLRCQQHVRNFAQVLPDDVWHLLWKSQTLKYYRPKHLLLLAQDMKSVDVEMDAEEWLQYIDALQETGDMAAAARHWEAQRHRLGGNAHFAPTFWMIGIQLYAALGRPQKAQTIAFECYDHTTMISPRVLVMVIAAWAKSHSPNAETKAWLCYLELRRRLEAPGADGGEVDALLEALGSVSRVLLEAGRTELALAVFKDMFLLRANSPGDSWRVFQQLATELGAGQSPNEEVLSQIGLSSLAVLPRSFHNKFFFAAWIKWLLGQDRADDAALVLELMYARGVKPDARHLNGILATWLRDGSPGARQKAEDTAWAMIQSRIELVQRRLPPSDALPSARTQVPLEARHTPIFLRRGAPAATIETFSILLLHYTRRSDASNASHLTEIMTTAAQIKPNSFIMNHWLYASLRSGQIPAVWHKYSALKQTITPDLETFAALWDTGKTHYGSYVAHNQKFPDARTLFAEMQDWFDALDTRKRQSAVDEFSAELYEQIIRCFCLSSDPEGTLCAMHGLRRSFHALPHEQTTHLIIMQIARSLPSVFTTPGSRPVGGRRHRKVNYQSSVAKLTEIVVAIMDKRLADTARDGSAFEDNESEASRELRLDVLSSFLCMVLDKRVKGSGDLQHDLSAVAQQMRTVLDPDVVRRRDWDAVAS